MPTSRLARSVLRTQSDERLTELARHGSDPAFETLVARYRRSLVSHCRRVAGESDAEEAVQNALLRAHRAIVRGDEVRSPGAWLHAIAYNSALNVVRARNARPEGAQIAAEPLDELQIDSVQRRADFQEVIAAVQELPERQREAIVMRELEGRSYEEIAATLETSTGAVRQLLNRARRALRERVGAFTGAEPLIRWLMDGGNGATAARIGALGGGCAVTAKLCASALLPAAVLGVATAPSEPNTRTVRTASAAQHQHAAAKATASAGQAAATTTNTTAPSRRIAVAERAPAAAAPGNTAALHTVRTAAPAIPRATIRVVAGTPAITPVGTPASAATSQPRQRQTASPSQHPATVAAQQPAATGSPAEMGQ